MENKEVTKDGMEDQFRLPIGATRGFAETFGYASMDSRLPSSEVPAPGKVKEKPAASVESPLPGESEGDAESVNVDDIPDQEEPVEVDPATIPEEAPKVEVKPERSGGTAPRPRAQKEKSVRKPGRPAREENRNAEHIVRHQLLIPMEARQQLVSLSVLKKMSPTQIVIDLIRKDFAKHRDEIVALLVGMKI